MSGRATCRPVANPSFMDQVDGIKTTARYLFCKMLMMTCKSGSLLYHVPHDHLRISQKFDIRMQQTGLERIPKTSELYD